MQLSVGSIVSIHNNVEVKEPTVQVINIKKILPTSPQQTDRYRLIISDGTHYMQAMLATQWNHIIAEDKLTKNGIIVLKKYITNSVHNRRIVIIVEIEVVNREMHMRIGEPVNIEPGQANTTTSTTNSSSAGGNGASLMNQRQDSFEGNESFGQVANSSIPMKGGMASGTTATTTNRNTSSTSSTPSNTTGAYGSSSTGRASGSRDDDSSMPVFPIRNINPYQNRWMIKARIANKSDIKTWRNAKGDGKLFSLDLIDDSGEIRATAFNEAVDKFYDLIDINKVYFISKAQVKAAKRQFSSIRNEYELTLDSNSTVQLCREDTSSIPTIRFNFIAIDKLNEIDKDSMVDVIGIVKDVDEITQVTSRTTQKQIPKRDLTLIDMGGRTVRLTLWNQQAENFNSDQHPVLAIKGAKMSDYNGISLSTTQSTLINLNPDIQEAHQLRGWYDSIGFNVTGIPAGGSTLNAGSTGLVGSSHLGADDEFKTLVQIKDENLGHGEKPSYFSTKATITAVKHDATFAYPACPTPNCNKKVSELGVGRFYCEKCQREYPKCDYRYVLSMGFTDHTTTSWLSCFNDTGSLFLGHSADELMQWKQNGDADRLLACFNAATYKSYHLKIRAKQESYQGEMKVRCQIMSATPLDYIKDSKPLVADIHKLLTA